MKYDEMIRTFRKYGWEFEMPAGVEYKAMEDGTWRQRYTEWRNEDYDVTIYPNEDEAVKAILQTVYFYANQCLVNNETADLKPSAHAVEKSRQVMDIFDKGVFRDVAPDTYHPEKHSFGKNSAKKDGLKLAKAAGLAAIGISAALALLKQKKKVSSKQTEGWFEVQKKDVIAIVEKKMDRHPWYIDPNESYRCLIYRARHTEEIFMTVDEFRVRDRGYLCCTAYSTLLCKNIEEYKSLSEDTFVRKAYNTWMNGAH